MTTFFLVWGIFMKKSLCIFMVLLISFYMIIPSKKSHAVGEGVILKVVGGEAMHVFEGMASRAGIKFATESAKDIAFKRWKMELYNAEQDALKKQNVEALIKQVNSYKPESINPLKGKKNVGAYAMNTLLFLTGVDVLVDVVDYFNNQYKTSKMVEVADTINSNIQAGTAFTHIGNFYVRVNGEDGRVFFYIDDSNVYTMFGMSGIWKSITPQDGNVYLQAFGCRDDGCLYSDGRMYKIYDAEKPVNDIDVVKSFPISSSDLPVNNSQPWVMDKNQIDFGNLPNNIPIEVPIDDSVPIEVPINEPFPDINKAPNYDPLYPGDYPDPGTDPGKNPDPGTDPGKNPDPGTDPGKNPDPGTDPGKNPDPGTDPGTEPGKEPNPEPNVPGEGVPTSNPDDISHKFGQLITTKFPFSLPWDIANVFKAIVATPKVPEIKMDITRTFNGKLVNFKFDHKMTYLEPFHPFWRSFMDLSFIVFLILAVRKLFGGAE